MSKLKSKSKINHVGEDVKETEPNFYKFVDPKTGKEYRITEATEDFRYFIRHEDYSGAISCDPAECVDARGIKRTDKKVEAVYIGAGKEAYVCYGEEVVAHDAVAKHYILSTSAMRVRDHFEATKGKKPIAQVVTLQVATPGQTVKHRYESNGRRREQIKNGSPIKRRGPNKNPTKKMLYPRPKPTVIDGFVTMPIV